MTFFDLTNPASSIAKPAAIHITKKPPIKNNNVLNTKTPCAETRSELVSSAYKIVVDSMQTNALIKILNKLNI